QAFALSYGDINSTMGGLGEIDLEPGLVLPYSALLDFSSGGEDVFWLRSTACQADYSTSCVGVVYNGIVFTGLPTSTNYALTRPALWVTLD
ncbi:MAG: hypothetical protein LBS33_07935, partial [Streptococcaceae bacterium]|nr:hypothetical protein [Streptococcaceae bacterium]